VLEVLGNLRLEVDRDSGPVLAPSVLSLRRGFVFHRRQRWGSWAPCRFF